MNGASYEWSMRVREFDLANRGECENSATGQESKRLLERLGEIIEGDQYETLHDEASVCRQRISLVMSPRPDISAGDMADYRRRVFAWAEEIVSRADSLDISIGEDLFDSIRELGRHLATQPVCSHTHKQRKGRRSK